ncbi:hypothetical protein HWV62_31736 [Athelia sp. TMB]|nr:hypothetical protein HWV62_31736 [Athelia sp. TMB]
MAAQTALRAVRPALARRWTDELAHAGSKVVRRNLAAIAAPSLSYLPLPAHAPPAPAPAPPHGEFTRLAVSSTIPVADSTDDGADLADDSLFSYTSGRWLYNEAEQLAQRYLKFDVGALHRVVFDVCGSPVVAMEKKEGLFNKSFMCTLADGQQVTARIKNPIAGPEHLMTASEVATMDYVRSVLHVPAPRVLAWSSRAATNGVGAEYILMETAAGRQLGDVWGAMGAARKKDVVNAVIAAESRLSGAKFAAYGSLYYTDDIAPAQRAPRLYADPNQADDGRFCIGPTANRAFYEDERGSMELERGPWATPEAYLCALAAKEEAWIAAHAKPNVHDDPFRAAAGPQVAAEHVAVLAQYRAIVPALVPKDEKVRASVLWHPDLNPGNVFVGEGGEVTSIIDWQGAWAGPAYLQMTTPAFVAYTGPDELPAGAALPTLPPAFDKLNPKKQEAVRAEHRAKMLHKLYEIKQLLPAGVHGPQRETRVLPARAAGRTWKDGILPLQLALLDVVAAWPALSTPETPCPLRFTRADVAALHAQRDRYCEWHAFLDDLRASFGMRLYGWVAPGEWAGKKRVLEETRGRISGALVREAERLSGGEGWWPFRDTVGASAPRAHSADGARELAVM